MTQPWYDEVTEQLIGELKEKGKVSGVEFLVEFFINNQSELISESEIEASEDDSVDYFVRNNIDDYEAWLKENKSEMVEFGRRYQWKRPSQPGENDELSIVLGRELSLEGLDLSDDEVIVIEKNLSSLLASDLSVVDSMYEKVLGGEDHDLIAKASLRVAIVFELSNGDDSEKIKRWEMCGDKEKFIKKTACFQRYSTAALIAALKLDHLKSGKLYEKAVDAFKPFNDSSQELIELLRSARRQYEISGADSDASRLYVIESGEHLKSTRCRWLSPLFLFWLFSKYGESPGRVITWAIAVISLSAILYFFCGVYSSAGYLAEVNTAPSTTEHLINFETVGCLESLKVSVYYSVVTFTTLGYGDFSPSNGWVRFISALEAVFGLLLTSLFMVTVVRKYSR